MSFDIIPITLSANLANAGTVTVTYPTGRTRGDYNVGQSGAHVLVINGNKYIAPTNFLLTFNANASNITLTNGNMGTLPANASGFLQVERFGADNNVSLRNEPNSAVPPVNMVAARPFLVDLGSPNALSTNGIAASQSITGTTVTQLATLNGTGTDVTANADGSVTLNTPRNVTAAWTTTAVLTVKGFDVYGNAMSEASASGTALTGKKAFKKITSVTSSVDITSLTVGYGDVLGLPIAIHNASQITTEIVGTLAGGERPRKTRLPFYFTQVDLLAGNPQPIVAPFAGTITNVGTQVSVAVTTGGTIVVKDGTTAATGTTTIANSAAVLAQQTVAVTANNTVAKGDALTVVPASFASAGALGGYVELTPSVGALSSGTLVVADVNKSTTTTGDVRGTYTPEVANDGTTGLVLIVMPADPTDIGSPQT